MWRKFSFYDLIPYSKHMTNWATIISFITTVQLSILLLSSFVLPVIALHLTEHLMSITNGFLIQGRHFHIVLLNPSQKCSHLFLRLIQLWNFYLFFIRSAMNKKLDNNFYESNRF